MSKNSSRLLRALMQQTLLVTFAVTAQAQAPKPNAREADAASAQGGDSGRLEEIVVTAQRRAENIQDVPITMQAFSEAQLAASNVQSVTDLSRLTPGLNFQDSSNNTFPTIRGVGSLLQSASTANSVSIYYDDVYLTRLSGLALELGNIKQVQVLKGPQATLYGRNATGGAIAITTDVAYGGDPLAGHVDATWGSYELNRYVASVGGGLSDTMGFNLSGAYITRDGNVQNRIQNIYHTGDDLESLDTYQFNGKLSYRPTDGVSAVLSVLGGGYNDTSGYGFRQAYPQSAAALLSAFTGLPPATFQFSSTPKETYQRAGRRKGSFILTSLTVDVDTSIGEFKSISAYARDSVISDLEVIHGSPGVAGASTDSPSETVSQEFRLSSDSDGPFKWTTGATYLDDGSYDGKWGGSAVFQRDPNQRALPPPQSSVVWSRTAWSAYGDLTYALTDSLSLTGGARYTEEKSDARTVASTLPGLLGTAQNSKDDDVTYRLVAKYEADVGMVYLSAAKGYKAGGINSYNSGSPLVKPESVLSFEAGYKSIPVAGILTVNASLFTYDFKDIQVQRIGGATGIETFYGNGDSATISGMDLELALYATHDLTVNAGATWLWDREYDDVKLAAQPGLQPFDASGNKVASAPKLSALLGIQYDKSLANGASVVLSANGEYNSGYFFDVSNLVGTGGTTADSYSLLSLRGTYTLPGGRFSVSVYGTNVLDEEYIRAGYPVFNGVTGSIIDGRPDEYGVTLGYRF